MNLSATFSIRDNKIRLYPGEARLPQDLYDRIKEAGFTWAPGQKIFIGQMWTPERFDLAVELAGEVEDEDISLVERAEARAERFNEHSANRAADAERAHAYVDSITNGIPLGQPILVGHHSQAHAERDAKRIERGIERAVNMWETSQYWQRRAKAALQHADFKERDDVRHRRIKGLESDLRKHKKDVDQSAALLTMWTRPDVELDMRRALGITNREHISQCFTTAEYPRKEGARIYEGPISLYSALADEIITPEQARDIAVRVHTRRSTWHNRWVAHIENRIIFEKAMLGESGGLAADNFDLQPGGRVLVHGEWVTIIRVTKKEGKVISVTTSAKYVRVAGIEEIKDYQPPTEEIAAAVKTLTKLAPMCNYDHESFVKMTKAEWEAIYKDYKGSTTVGAGAKGDRYDRVDAGPFATYGPHRLRSRYGQGTLRCVFLTDVKVTLPPPAPAVPAAVPTLPPAERTLGSFHAAYVAPEPTKFDALKDTLKAGVQVVSASQLFPTPPDLAARMVELAQIRPGDEVLEPSAGTGNILRALQANRPKRLVAIEINYGLVDILGRGPLADLVLRGDFLAMSPERTDRFDVILMNPPFERGDDIKHILHALTFLKPGGRLVAICAGGPRQKAALESLCDLWEPLPAGTFESSGTSVNTVLLTMYANEIVNA